MDVSPTIVSRLAGSTSSLLVANSHEFLTGYTYTYQAESVSLKAYVNTPRLTLASTTLVSGVTNATSSSFTPSIQNAVASYFGEIYDSSDSIVTTSSTTSSTLYISPKWGQPPFNYKKCVIILYMPRTSRIAVGGEVYHIINRANGRLTIFNTKEDYQLFEQLLSDTKELTGMKILAYTIMPNHWHLILHPEKDGDLTMFMQRLSNSHTRKVHSLTKTNGSGHLYQGRYKSFLVESNEYLLTVIKYVERNPVRAKLSKRCEEWQWGSAYRRLRGTAHEKKILDTPPTDLPSDYLRWINRAEDLQVVQSIRTSVIKGVPYGGESWIEKMVATHKLHSTTRSPGRPRMV